MRSLLPILPLVAAAALAGCAGFPVDQTADAMLGQPKAQLVQCAGAPTQTVNATGREFLTYRSDIGPKRYRSSTWCIMTFTVRDGHVTKWTGDWDGPPNGQTEACEEIVSACAT